MLKNILVRDVHEAASQLTVHIKDMSFAAPREPDSTNQHPIVDFTLFKLCYMCQSEDVIRINFICGPVEHRTVKIIYKCMFQPIILVEIIHDFSLPNKSILQERKRFGT